MKLFTSQGKLRYSENKLIVEVDKELSRFYFSMIPKYHKVRTQMYAPHISVVRKETPPQTVYWGMHEGEIIDFMYEPWIYNDETYWWLNTFSTRLEDIRFELGLPVSSPYTLPPSGFVKCFHCTLGNTKTV